MSYLPLARKYRPQTFEDLVGQPHVTSTLSRALEGGRAAQAYLFAGMRGVGKTSAARILAKCLNCERGPTATPCQQCANCVQITQGSSLDVIEIDGASNRGIDEIRSLRETVPFAPISGPFRIYIIDEVHMLTPEAFNALLKTLEEPPAHVKFIFATTAANKIPATILSRCQRFDFRRLEATTLVKTLRRVADAERIQVSEPALYAIARASEGSLRDAEVVLEQLSSFVDGPIEEAHVTELLGAIETDALFAWAQAILDRDAPQAIALMTQQLDQGKDPQQLLTRLLHHLRNLLIVRTTHEAPSQAELLVRLIDEPTDRLKRLQEQSDRFTPQELLLLLQMLGGAYELVRRSPMARTILELVVIKLCTREQWQSLDDITRRLEQLSGGGAAGPSPEAPRSLRATTATAQPVDPTAQDPPPVPSPVSAAMSAPEEVGRLWPMFLERLGSKKMSLAAYLADAKPLRLEHGALTVGLPGFALHQEVLSVVENRRLITGLLSELYQAPITVEYTTLPNPVQPPDAAPAPAVPTTPPVVQEIVNLFNATLIDRPRTT